MAHDNTHRSGKQAHLERQARAADWTPSELSLRDMWAVTAVTQQGITLAAAMDQAGWALAAIRADAAERALQPIWAYVNEVLEERPDQRRPNYRIAEQLTDIMEGKTDGPNSQ